MIAVELLEILACPDTHQSLAMAEAELVASLNAAIEAGFGDRDQFMGVLTYRF